MLFYCIRHGQSTYNAEGRIQGQRDVPLSDLGQRQGQAVAAALEDCPIEAVYSSPLRRAVETAEPLAARLGVPLRTDPRLMEIHAGVFQDQCRDQLDELFPNAMTCWRSGDPDFAIPGGESRTDLMRRGVAAFHEMLQGDCRQVAVVTHGGLLIAVLKGLLGIPAHLYPFALENGSISQLEVIGQEAKLLSLNEVGHLRLVGMGDNGEL